MNIYYWIWSDCESKKDLYDYCGGTTVVVANSKEEAKKLILEKNASNSTHIIDIDLIYEIKGATIDCKEPKILINEGYVE